MCLIKAGRCLTIQEILDMMSKGRKINVKIYQKEGRKKKSQLSDIDDRRFCHTALSCLTVEGVPMTCVCIYICIVLHVNVIETSANNK